MEKDIRKYLWGQKAILTVLEDEILAEDEAHHLYATAIKSGVLEYLFKEGKQEYTIEDCKTK